MPVWTRICANSPRLGIFWVIPMAGNDWAIVSVLNECKHVVAVGGFRTMDEGHVDAWPRLGGTSGLTTAHSRAGV